LKLSAQVYRNPDCALLAKGGLGRESTTWRKKSTGQLLIPTKLWLVKTNWQLLVDPSQ